jgi:hypothetical protein
MFIYIYIYTHKRIKLLNFYQMIIFFFSHRSTLTRSRYVRGILKIVEILRAFYWLHLEMYDILNIAITLINCCRFIQ